MSERPNDPATGDDNASHKRRRTARRALLALPKTVLTPFVLFYSSLRGIWSDPASRGILFTALVLLVAGTIIFMFVEGFSPVDSFYFCFITLSTIGYGDFSPTTELGKVLTVMYGIVGLGIIAALVSAIAAQRTRRSRAESDENA